jgi:hypothetical protein
VGQKGTHAELVDQCQGLLITGFRLCHLRRRTIGPQGSLSALADLLPDASGSGLRTGLLIGTTFPLGVVATALAYGITVRRQAHNARVTNTP